MIVIEAKVDPGSIANVKRNLAKYRRVLRDEMDQALGRAADRIADHLALEFSRRAPVATGRLRRGFRSDFELFAGKQLAVAKVSYERHFWPVNARTQFASKVLDRFGATAVKIVQLEMAEAVARTTARMGGDASDTSTLERIERFATKTALAASTST